MASSGLVTRMLNESGAYFFTFSATLVMILMLVSRRSSLDIPGFLGRPAVMILTSEPLICDQSAVPESLTSQPRIGVDSVMSSAFPWTTLSTSGISTIVTSPNSFWAARRARMPPICPPPIKQIFFRATSKPPSKLASLPPTQTRNTTNGEVDWQQVSMSFRPSPEGRLEPGRRALLRPCSG